MTVHEDDRALVNAAKNGNTKCFEELYNRYYEKIFALAKSVVKNDADAEDVLQITFINAWKNIGRLENTDAFKTWISRIAINECNSMLRKNKPGYSLDEEGDDGEMMQIESDLMLPEQYAEREDLSARLKEIIDELSVSQRETIMLYYFSSMSVEEIAQTMDCSEGTVKSRLFLARKTIKAEIEERERKTGEKFYGVSGVVFIPFAGVLIKQINESIIAADKAAGIFGKISQSILNTPLNPGNIAQQASAQRLVPTPKSVGGAAAKTAASAAKTTFPLWAKVVSVIAGISLVATGGMVAIKALKTSNDVPEDENESIVSTQEVFEEQTQEISTTEAPKTIREIDPKDMPDDLTEFLQIFNFAYSSGVRNKGTQDAVVEEEYDYRNLDNIYDSFLNCLVGNAVCVDLDKYPGGKHKEIWDEHDPLKRYEYSGYIAVPKKKVIWIMKNIFNISEKDVDGMIKAGMKSRTDIYEYDENGITYLCNRLGGVGGPGYHITYKTVMFDGEKYYFTYELRFWEGKPGQYISTYYAEMELKEIDGVKYWSLYRHTEDIPNLPKPNNTTTEKATTTATTKVTTKATTTASKVGNDWSSIYKDFILNKKYLSSSEGWLDNKQLRDRLDDGYSEPFYLYDLNKDGTPELFMDFGYIGGSNPHNIYTVKNGKLKLISDKYFIAWGSINIYCPGSKYYGLFCEGGRMGSYGIEYYYMSGDTIEKKSVMSEVAQNQHNDAEFDVTIEDKDLYDTYMKYSEYYDYSGGDAEKPFENSIILYSQGKYILPAYSQSEIASMGWNKFVKAYGY